MEDNAARTLAAELLAVMDRHLQQPADALITWVRARTHSGVLGPSDIPTLTHVLVHAVGAMTSEIGWVFTGNPLNVTMRVMTPRPHHAPPLALLVQATMTEALKAELAGDYDRVQSLLSKLNPDEHTARWMLLYAAQAAHSLIMHCKAYELALPPWIATALERHR